MKTTDMEGYPSLPLKRIDTSQEGYLNQKGILRIPNEQREVVPPAVLDYMPTLSVIAAIFFLYSPPSHLEKSHSAYIRITIVQSGRSIQGPHPYLQMENCIAFPPIGYIAWNLSDKLRTDPDSGVWRERTWRYC